MNHDKIIYLPDMRQGNAIKKRVQVVRGVVIEEPKTQPRIEHKEVVQEEKDPMELISTLMLYAVYAAAAVLCVLIVLTSVCPSVLRFQSRALCEYFGCAYYNNDSCYEGTAGILFLAFQAVWTPLFTISAFSDTKRITECMMAGWLIGTMIGITLFVAAVENDEAESVRLHGDHPRGSYTRPLVGHG